MFTHGPLQLLSPSFFQDPQLALELVQQLLENSIKPLINMIIFDKAITSIQPSEFAKRITELFEVY
jgi:hypothetical protein